jgi:hypothetical protein
MLEPEQPGPPGPTLKSSCGTIQNPVPYAQVVALVVRHV